MTAQHGTTTRYRNGCRCDQCRAANTARDRAYRDRAGLPDTTPTPTPARDLTAPAPTGKVAAKLEDLEFLLDVGEDPHRAVARIGWHVLSARRACQRHGRHDLAIHLRERAA